MITTPEPKWGSPGPTHDPAILANFVARPSDVLITTTTKAGTTWMQQILHQLRSGGDPDFFSIDDVVPWLELPRPGKSVAQVLSGYDAIANPRIFKTHCTFEQTPGVDTARIMLSSRDPRDCCVSYWHHVRDMNDRVRNKVGLKQYSDFESFFEDWLTFGSWYRNVGGWWPERNRHNLLWLRYEDMKHDLPGAIDSIIDFLGWEVDHAGREAAVEYSSFDWMKSNAEKFTRQLSSNVPVFKPGTFIRKGAIGGYKERLTKAQEERILAKAGETLPGDCLDYLQIG